MSGTQLPRGFEFAGVTCGIKTSGKPDLSLLVADRPVVAAGVYTQNQIVAAPVLLCRQRTPSNEIRAVLANSGNANACTGEQGWRDAQQMCRLLAAQMSIPDSSVLVMSTGVIGKTLPMERIEAGITSAAAKVDVGLDAFHAAADAILTTDVARKVELRELDLGGPPVRIAAMAKGAGMIAPNMATMLGVIITDAELRPDQAQRLLKHVAEASFNRVSVDGHTSTNDTLLLLSSGASGVQIDDSNEAPFVAALSESALALARRLVADGEGAKHVLKVSVQGARSDVDAETIARAVGASPLVKTAVAGGDPNWGRIVSAAGYAGPPIEPGQTSLRVAGVEIYREGTPTDYDEAAVSAAMKSSPEVEMQLRVGSGPGQATHWASDLTVEYVRFNSEYTT